MFSDLWLHIVTCEVCVSCTVLGYTLTQCTIHCWLLKCWRNVYSLFQYRIMCSDMTVMYSVVHHGLFKDDFKFSSNKVRLVELVLEGKSLSYLKLFIFFQYGLHWQKEKFSKYILKVILHMMSWRVYLFHSCCLVVKLIFVLTLVCR